MRGETDYLQVPIGEDKFHVYMIMRNYLSAYLKAASRKDIQANSYAVVVKSFLARQLFWLDRREDRIEISLLLVKKTALTEEWPQTKIYL